MTVATTTLGTLVAEHGRRVRLRAGQVLFREGDDSSAVYACVEGRLNLFISTPSGRDVLLGLKVPTQAFGELSAIDGRPRSATAIAMLPSVIAQLSGDEFLDHLEHVPLLALSVLRELADQMRSLNVRMSARSVDSTSVRVAQVVLELSEKFRRHSDGKSAVESVTVPVTQDEIAAWVGCTREAAARALADFRRTGVVLTGRSRVVVPDIAALRLEIATASRALARA